MAGSQLTLRFWHWLQAEERAQLCLASQKKSRMLRLHQNDLVLYAARVIPGNDKQASAAFAGVLQSASARQLKRSLSWQFVMLSGPTSAATLAAAPQRRHSPWPCDTWVDMHS